MAPQVPPASARDAGGRQRAKSSTAPALRAAAALVALATLAACAGPAAAVNERMRSVHDSDKVGTRSGAEKTTSGEASTSIAAPRPRPYTASTGEGYFDNMEFRGAG